MILGYKYANLENDNLQRLGINLSSNIATGCIPLICEVVFMSYQVMFLAYICISGVFRRYMSDYSTAIKINISLYQ